MGEGQSTRGRKGGLGSQAGLPGCVLAAQGRHSGEPP